MKKCFLFAGLFLCATIGLLAQDDEKGFKKENLFTGGTISVGFSNNTFLIGGSPVFGYSITPWIDAGVVGNYIYSTARDVSYGFNAKLRQTIYGGGAFLKIYPVRFLFAQAQVEHNIIRQKYIPTTGSSPEIAKVNANSFLIGGGYATNRQPGGGIYFHVAILFDIAKELWSPYTDSYGRIVPNIRGGVHIPLFQPK